MTPETEHIFYKLSEAAAELGVETAVLRFWEKEFKPFITPLKAGPRKKLYRPEDVATFQAIKTLLYEEGFTVAGARRRLATSSTAGDQAEPPAQPNLLAEVRRELLDLRRLLVSGRTPGGSSEADRPTASPEKPAVHDPKR